MTDGHEAPNIHRRPINPQTLIPQTPALSWSRRAAAKRRRNQKNHLNPAQPCANSSKRCIKRARSVAKESHQGEIWQAVEVSFRYVYLYTSI